MSSEIWFILWEKQAPMQGDQKPISFSHLAVSVPVPHLGEDWIHADGMIDVFGGVLHETIVILLNSFLRGTFAILSWGRLGVFNIKKGCTEACKARQCCFGTKAENCVEMYPP